MKKPQYHVCLSLIGLFEKHNIQYSRKQTRYSYYFTVWVADKEFLLRVSDHDQTSAVRNRKQTPDFDLRDKKDYTTVKKVIKGLKYNGEYER